MAEAMPNCPFFIECRFYNSSEMTASDKILRQLFCFNRHDACHVAKRILNGKPVPAGACPDGEIKA